MGAEAELTELEREFEHAAEELGRAAPRKADATPRSEGRPGSTASPGCAWVLC